MNNAKKMTECTRIICTFVNYYKNDRHYKCDYKSKQKI